MPKSGRKVETVKPPISGLYIENLIIKISLKERQMIIAVIII